MNKREKISLIIGLACLLMGLVSSYFAPEAAIYNGWTYAGGLLGLGAFLLLYVLARPFIQEIIALIKRWKK